MGLSNYYLDKQLSPRLHPAPILLIVLGKLHEMQSILQVNYYEFGFGIKLNFVENVL